MIRNLVLAGLLSAGLLLAQRGGGMGAPSLPPPMPRAHATRTDQIASKLKLNKEQRQQLESILAEASEKAAPVRQELDRQRGEIATALIDGRPQADVDKALSAYAEVAARMTAVEGEAFAKICAVLKSGQQSRAPQAFELMAGLFSREQAAR